VRSVGWLDVTADAAGCWVRTAQTPSRPVLLEPPHTRLRPALRLDGRRLTLGQIAWSQRRVQPHLVVPTFLEYLGDERVSWRLGRHVVTPRQGAALLLQIVRERLGATRRLLISVPGYWRAEQAHVFHELARAAGFECLGIVSRELLYGLEANAGESAWKHDGVLLDADDCNLVAAVLRPTATELRQVGVAARSGLGRAVWRGRLVEAVALRAIAAQRRDPRAVPQAEQVLYDQSERWLSDLAEGRAIQAEAYLSHRALPLRIELGAAEATRTCQDLAEAAAELCTALQRHTVRPVAGGALYLTADAAQLPGLAPALYARSGHQQPVIVLGNQLVSTALSLAESIAEKERPPIDFGSRTVAFPLAEFTFDAPSVLTFPGEGDRRAAQN
jgi:hypothetical protein